MPDDFDIDSFRQWQRDPVTIRLKNILQALLIETQQLYAAATSREQFEYLRGLEIGYMKAGEAIELIAEPVKIEMVSVPTIIRPEPKGKNGKDK